MQNKNNKIRTQSTAGHHWSFSAVRQRKRGQDRFSSSIMILWHCENWDLQLAKIEYLCNIRRLWRGVLKELTFWTMQVPWTAQAMIARCHDGNIGTIIWADLERVWWTIAHNVYKHCMQHTVHRLHLPREVEILKRICIDCAQEAEVGFLTIYAWTTNTARFRRENLK